MINSKFLTYCVLFSFCMQYNHKKTLNQFQLYISISSSIPAYDPIKVNSYAPICQNLFQHIGVFETALLFWLLPELFHAIKVNSAHI